MDKLGQMVIVVPDEGLAITGVGKLEPGIYFAREADGTTTIMAKVGTGIDKAIKYLQDTLAKVSKSAKKAPLTRAFLQEVKRVEELAQGFVRAWKDTLNQGIRNLKYKVSMNPREFGAWLHDEMEVVFQDLVSKVGRLSKCTC